MAEDRPASRAAERRFTRHDEPTAGPTERREVRADDPSLSPEANQLLTNELRDIIGEREVEVPAGQPHRAGERHATHSTFVATLLDNRPVIIVMLLVALVVGAAVSLATDSYWAVIAALGVHAVGTVAVIFGVTQLTTEQEHVAPGTAALLEEEGVADPDRLLSDMVEDFAGASDARGATEVMAGGHNERTVGAEHDPAKAMVEQRTAQTPQSRPGKAVGGGAVEVLPWTVVTAVMIFSIVVAAIAGGEMWIVPLIALPIGAAWILGQLWWYHSGPGAASPDRRTGDEGEVRRRVLPLAVGLAAAVVAFLILMGRISGDL